MKKSYAAAVVPAMIAAMMFAPPADARAKKPKRSDVQKRYELQQTPQSLDGRALGQMRACGFDYHGLGTPYGPYCHSIELSGARPKKIGVGKVAAP